MRWVMRARQRVRALLRRTDVDRELDVELHEHLQRLIDEYVAQGLPLAEARRAAQREFGGVAQIGEACRDTRRLAWLDHLLQDTRYALRVLASRPAFTLAAVLTLTIGFGANTAIFTVVYHVLLRPLPFPEPERLVVVQETFGDMRTTSPVPNYLDFVAQARSFEALGATLPSMLSMSGSDEGGPVLGEPERIPATRATASYFVALRATPALGRLFVPEDDAVGAPAVAVLSHALWQRRFNGDPSIVGRLVRLDRIPHTIVGVLPRDARLGESTEQIYVPLAPLAMPERTSAGRRILTVIGRLRPDVSIAAAQQEMAAIMAHIAKVRPGGNTQISATVVPLDSLLVKDARASLGLLFGAAGLVLLIACANVANLHLARAASRQKECALRLSLGATRGRLVRQFLTEQVCLGLLGVLGGAFVAYGSLGLLTTLLPAGIPRLTTARLDGTVLAISLALGLIVTLVFGIVPALQTSRPDLQSTLKEGGRTAAAPSRHAFGAALVVGEIALALMALTAAGLLIRSFVRVQEVSPGFETQRLLTLRLSLPEARYGGPEALSRFYADSLDRIRQIPGVTAAGAATQIPLDRPGRTMMTPIEGRPAPKDGDFQNWPIFSYRLVTPGYVRALGLRVLEGRDLTEADTATSPRAALINASAARRHWPTGSPIGQRLKTDDGDARPLEIVGVVADTRHFGLDQEARPELFIPAAQSGAFVWRAVERSMTIVARTSGDPADIASAARAVVRRLDPELPIYQVQTMDQIVSGSRAASRALTSLLSVFAAAAIGLAAVGVYGLVAFLVSQRHHEFGVRLALGATGSAIRALVLGRALLLAIPGVLLGLAGALAASRLLKALLYQVSPSDPLVLAAVAGLVVAITLLACWIPARRAARVDPLALLRQT